MINTILKAKHWQVFLAIFVLPAIFYLVFFISWINSISEIQHHNMQTGDLTDIFGNFNYLGIAILLSTIPLFMYFYALGVGLQQYMPSGYSMKVKRFKWFWTVPLIFNCMAVILVFWFVSELAQNPEGTKVFFQNFEQNPKAVNPVVIAFAAIVISLLQLFVVFCTFYIYYFIGKTIKAAEIQREPKSDRYIGYCVLIWFSFIGVWFLQPTVNKIQDGSLPPEIPEH